MAKARRAKPTVKFNGKNVNESIAPYLKSIAYTDVACGSSDSLDITLQNIDMKWLNGWYPTKGDKIDASILFENWTEPGKNFTTQCGNFVLDTIGFKGGPLEASFGGLAIPASESFKETERTKTWKSVTIQQIGAEIAKKYAYLVACVLMRKYSLLADGYSPYEQRPVVISTSSIALQKAILTEYIPFLSRILQENGTIQAPIKAVIRKGKEHFVCDERLAQRIVAIKDKNKNALQKEALLSLKEHYDMDEVSGLSGFDRRMVSVPKFCSRECPKKGSCRYQQYLEHSRDDEMFIQICNHNYLLADGYHRLQDYRPLLKDYRALIVDEAF